MRLPFILKPAYKDYLWGGTRLIEEYGKQADRLPLAESWECSTHPDGLSMLEGGMSLKDAIEENPSRLGTHVLELTGGKAELPILIKLLDAKEDLSIQVHPDDEYALRKEGELGKTEMWYVLDAAPGAELLLGFHRSVTKAEVRKAAEEGRLSDLMNHVPVRKNEVYYIPAGTVHAIGKDTIVAEIQESSNLIYRLYDYDRKDGAGRLRELHIERALEVAELEGGSISPQAMRVLRYRPGCATELLIRCKYFMAERMLLQSGECESTEYKTGTTSFHALLCIEGCGCIHAKGFELSFCKGDCIFVPAESEILTLSGKAQLLDVSC